MTGSGKADLPTFLVGIKVGFEAVSGSIPPPRTESTKALSAQSNGPSFCVGQFGFLK
jgi:hypothetical protein